MWTIRDEGGFPCPLKPDGKRSMPFWSSEGRVRRIIKNVPDYAGFEAVKLEWSECRERWLSGLKEDGHLVGVNWSGPRAVGYDVAPDVVRDAVERERLGIKDASIRGLVEALDFKGNGWVMTDQWDGDLCAIGIAAAGRPRPLVYVSTRKMAPGRYYFECETPNGPDPTDYEVTDQGDDVDLETLRGAMVRHLSATPR